MRAVMHRVGNGRWDSGRVETFSDGVFAIAITLLVLEIDVPKNLHRLPHALAHEWPAYLAYTTSFLTLGGVWVSHHTLYGRLRYVDSAMMRLNLLLLMAAAFLPFPTAILAEALRASGEAADTAVVLYGVTALVIEVLMSAGIHHADSHPALWSDPEQRPTPVTGTRGSSWLSPVIALYLVAIVLGIFEFPKIATAAYLLLAVMGLVTLGREQRAPARR